MTEYWCSNHRIDFEFLRAGVLFMHWLALPFDFTLFMSMYAAPSQIDIGHQPSLRRPALTMHAL